MSAPRIRADYDALIQIQQRFGQHSDACAQTLKRLQQAKDVLERGDWIGQGAKAFYREMNSEVLPSLKRLVAALQRASLLTLKIGQIVKQAEDEAASLLKLVGGSAGTSAAASAVAQAAAGDTPAAAATGTINFGANADQAAVSNHSRQVLQDIMKAAKLDSVTITSTARTPERQAIAMFENIESQGVAAQKDLYGPSGDRVIDVYVAEKAAGKSRAEIISAMEAKINELGPSTVSRHLADPSKLNVIDIAPSQIADRASFEKAVEADTRVTKFLKPPSDPAYHLEIPQPTTK